MSPYLVDAFAIAAIYYAWRLYGRWFHSQQRVLRERVAYMLWKAAEKLT